MEDEKNLFLNWGKISIHKGIVLKIGLLILSPSVIALGNYIVTISGYSNQDLH